MNARSESSQIKGFLSPVDGDIGKESAPQGGGGGGDGESPLECSAGMGQSWAWKVPPRSSDSHPHATPQPVATDLLPDLTSLLLAAAAAAAAAASPLLEQPNWTRWGSALWGLIGCPATHPRPAQA